MEEENGMVDVDGDIQYNVNQINACDKLADKLKHAKTNRMYLHCQ